MSDTDTPLPEGTDSIIAGASRETPEESLITEAPAPGGGLAEGVAAIRDRAGESFAGLKEDATARARDYATQGRDKAVDALDGVSKFVSDAAAQVDQTFGAQYGDYARKAADAVAGAASGLRNKELEDLIEDARAFVQRSPAIAIGAAAAAGFLVARLVKAGSETLEGVAQQAEPKGKDGAKNKPV